MSRIYTLKLPWDRFCVVCVEQKGQGPYNQPNCQKLNIYIVPEKIDDKYLSILVRYYML